MAVSLLLTTLLSVIVFIPLAILLVRSDATENSTLKKPAIFVFGGATWSVIAIFQLILAHLINLITDFPLAQESSLDSFIDTQLTARTPLFWYLFVTAVVGQILLYRGSLSTFESDTAWDFVIFGLGWGISEYIQRFMFFGAPEFDVQLYLFLFPVGIGIFIGATIIRIRENSKFIMFAALLKFFAEIGLFGEFGYQGVDVSLTELYGVWGLTIAMAGLSMITRKFPLKD